MSPAARGDADPLQEDLFGRKAAERAEAEEARWLRYLDDLDCCTGLPCQPTDADVQREDPHGFKRSAGHRPQGWEPPPWRRCGRCGVLTLEQRGYGAGHSGGWLGCASRDPLYEGAGYGRQLSWTELQHRHDARHRPPCVCGCAWGNHEGDGKLFGVRGLGPCNAFHRCGGYRPDYAALWTERPCSPLVPEPDGGLP